MNKRILKNRLLELIQARERMINRRIKLKDLALFVGVTNHTITSWIRNDVRKYEAHIIEGFCDYFDCDVADLLYFEKIEVEENPE
ncbi:MAG: helix-turn-helix transcriptional regulator [Chloroflexota bacterium]|nr:helix-turn-helix transcriptional regulator [Anaerolineae bacterium]